MWHREQDHLASAAAAHLLAQVLPHRNATFHPNETHFSTLANHVHNIWKQAHI
ncbi:MAG TPA: hypothetical protein VFV38_15435 [Ktedonobacteraceae bacterium]|nr:hypothetical protein [Ktedonobacteraceae bacterium]